LEAAAVLNRPFTAQQISELTSVDSHYATPLIDQWSKLGMVERTSDTEPEHYRFHTLIRDTVLNRLNPDDLRVLHRQAASYYGGPFLDAARRQALIRSGTVWSNARVSWLARDNNGILGLWLRRESDPQARKRTITRALRWHHHLLVARALPEAAQIAQTLAPVLDQEGQRDLSRLLLQQSLVNHNAMGQAEYLDEHLDTLAKLRLQDGHLQSALAVYEEVIASLSTSKNKVQRAYLRIRAGKIQQQMGDSMKAIDHYQRALKLMRSEDNVEGEAQALHSLAKAYRESGDSRQALVYSQCAMECYQELDHMQGVALIHYEQGLNLKALSRNEAALERFTASLKLARQLSDRVGIASALTQIGETFEALGQEQMAIKSLKEAANHYARLQSPKEQDVLSRLESIYAQRARFEQAVNQFREAKNGNL
jgi:tetratricopeptide (TPR) repeat protein